MVNYYNNFSIKPLFIFKLQRQKELKKVLFKKKNLNNTHYPVKTLDKLSQITIILYNRNIRTSKAPRAILLAFSTIR